MRAFILAGLLALSAGPTWGQQMAITFDDLPAHGAKPADMTRLDIAQSILATLKREHMPPTYGFINGQRKEEEAPSLRVLQAWRAAGQPLGNHTWAHQEAIHEWR
jgi:peptidoglycan/xylan/chitin deacetylase (PgdA/CDA1 family)